MDSLKPWERVLIRLLPLIMAITVTAVGGLAVLVESVDNDVEKLQDSTTSVEESVDSVARSTRRVEDFVDELEEQTPEEATQAAAVAEAVRQVPQLRVILCQAFPNVPACQEG